MADIYLHLNGEQSGPFSAEQVRAMLDSGEIAPDTLAWYEGQREWRMVTIVLGPLLSSRPSAQPPLPPLPPPVKQGTSAWIVALIVGLGLLAVFSASCCFGIFLGPVVKGIKRARNDAALQQACMISSAILGYERGHNGTFPPGNTSTEVFQQLLDGGFVTKPEIFYVAMPGKVKATSTQLSAQNVCFDVTSGITSKTPPDVPMVFTTGFHMDYGSNGPTITRAGPSPLDGIAICFTGDYRGSYSHFYDFVNISAEQVAQPVDSHGETYRQLTP